MKWLVGTKGKHTSPPLYTSQYLEPCTNDVLCTNLWILFAFHTFDCGLYLGRPSIENWRGRRDFLFPKLCRWICRGLRCWDWGSDLGNLWEGTICSWLQQAHTPAEKTPSWDPRNHSSFLPVYFIYR